MPKDKPLLLSIDDLLPPIGKARTQAALWATMVRLAGKLGFRGVGYLLFDKGRTGQALAVQHHGFPPELVNQYATMGYGLHDPILRVVFATGRAGAFKDILSRFKLTPAERQHKALVNDQKELQDAIGFPLFGPNGRDAYAVLGRPVRPELVQQVHLTTLHMAAQAAHLAALQLAGRPSMSGTGLSEREIEVLRWVALGKSNSVIAEIMGISTGTIDTYLSRVFEKLEVGDRTAAAVKGVSMGLIRA